MRKWWWWWWWWWRLLFSVAAQIWWPVRCGCRLSVCTMGRPAFFQSEALRLREPICRLQYCSYPKRMATVLGRISRFLSPSLGAVVARLLLFSIFLFFSLNCETCNAFRWENVLPEKKKKWWNAHTVPALPEKKCHVLAGGILFVSPIVHQC